MTPNTVDTPLRWMASGLLCLALSACDTAPTAVDRGFGGAVKQAQAQQSLYATPSPCLHAMPPVPSTDCAMKPKPPTAPMAGMNSPMHQQMHPNMHPQMHPQMHMPMGEHHRLSPADTDGVAAQAAVTRYQDSFKSPPVPAPVFNIGWGTPSAR